MSKRTKPTKFKLAKSNFLLILFSVFCFGMYYSRFFLSLTPYLILIYGFTLEDSWNKFKSFFQNKSFLSIFLIFFLYLFSGLNSQNHTMWLSRINTNLIFMVIPLGIYMVGPFTIRFINKVLAIFILTNLIISIVLLFGYFFNLESINEGYLSGNIIHTPMVYVRYSYFVALSIVFSYYLYVIRFKINFDWERYVYGFSILFLLVFLHVLAVRTGIFSLYITIILMAFIDIIKNKRYKTSFIGLGILVTIIFLSYQFLPTVKNKISYVKWDIKHAFDDNNPYHSSDKIRIYSIINGLKLLKEKPVFGVGIGDIESEMDKKYELNYSTLPKELRFEPINQYVFILASMGILGSVLYFGFLLVPLLYKRSHPIMIPFYILTFSTFIGETTIELIIGKASFLFLLSILINNYTSQKKFID